MYCMFLPCWLIGIAWFWILSRKENVDVATGDKVADSGDAVEEEVRPRSIKGVMRAGLLANGLLMKGEVSVHLVLLSRDKPTSALLSRVSDILTKQLSVGIYLLLMLLGSLNNYAMLKTVFFDPPCNNLVTFQYTFLSSRYQILLLLLFVTIYIVP